MNAPVDTIKVSKSASQRPGRNSTSSTKKPSKRAAATSGAKSHRKDSSVSGSTEKAGNNRDRATKTTSATVTMSHLNGSNSVRRNNATRAKFERYDLANPFAQGSFRWVAQGRYTEGDRAGQPCVCKWFKTESDVEAEYFDTDIKTSKKALNFISKWNKAKLVDKVVQVNLPQIWSFGQSQTTWSGRKVMQEPFIENYQKFNSNTGWSDDSTPWPRVMQALSHFSYHVSEGRQLLCDLQGGVYRNGVVLTDPVIMSVERDYGPTDLGLEGINSFFVHHQCNEYCRSSWRRPHDTGRSSYRPSSRTTMEIVPTLHSRAKMTMVKRVAPPANIRTKNSHRN